MFLGIDCGTQGTKAIVVSQSGVVLGTGHAPHRLIERENGAREQEPSWWVDAMVQAVRAAITEAGVAAHDVKALSVSGQQHGLVVLDAEGKSIRPAKLWNDTETAPQNAEIVARLGGSTAWFEQFGIVPLTGYTISKLLWLKETEPENFAKIRHILLPHDYLNYWLTGSFVSEYGDASGTAYFDVRRRQWAEQPLAAIDADTGFLARALPALIEADSPVGTLRQEAAALLGLSTDCLVAAGGGDNMMGAIGTGNVKEGIVTMSLGTSSTVYAYSATPIGDVQGCIAPFCSSSGGWLPLVCTMNATNVVTNLLGVLKEDVSYVSSALDASQPGADGITFLPFLNGERTPDLPTARGSIFGLSASNFTSNNLLRATVEGVTFGILAGLRLILPQRKPDRILLIGGGARSEGWRKLIADATGAVIEVPTTAEAGCLGASIQAHWAWNKQHGIGESIAEITARYVQTDASKATYPTIENHTRYEEAMERYRAYLAQHYGVLDNNFDGRDPALIK